MCDSYFKSEKTEVQVINPILLTSCAIYDALLLQLKTMEARCLVYLNTCCHQIHPSFSLTSLINNQGSNTRQDAFLEKPGGLTCMLHGSFHLHQATYRKRNHHQKQDNLSFNRYFFGVSSVLEPVIWRKQTNNLLSVKLQSSGYIKQMEQKE